MALAAITKYLDIEDPTMEMVQLTASNTNTYKSRKFKYVEAAIACINNDLDESINVCTSTNTAIDGTDQTVRLNGDSLSSSSVLLVLWGSG